MATRHSALSLSWRATACALALVLDACGGGGGGESAPDARVAAIATPAAAGADLTAQPAAPGGATALAVPSPPDMSVLPPPGTEVTPAPPDPSAGVAANGVTTGAGADATASAVTTGAPPSIDLPDGATACQPSTCPGFASNGSVTNTEGTDNPTAAHGYLLPGGASVSGAYPDLGRLPTLILPLAPVTVAAAPN